MKKYDNAFIIRMSGLKETIGLSRSTIYDLMNPNSPRYAPDFPKPVRLGATSKGAVGWKSSEVFDWLESRQRTR